MTAIDLHTTISRRAEIMSTDVGTDEMVMMNLDRGRYYGLESVGHTIWRVAEHPVEVAALVDDLLDRYDGIVREQCETETIAFLNQMLSEGLIVVHAPSE